MFTTLATDLLTYSEGDLFLIFEKEKDGSVTVHDETYRTGGGVTYDPCMGAGDDLGSMLAKLHFFLSFFYE